MSEIERDWCGPRPDPWPPETEVWLVWELVDTRLILRAIDTDELLAERHANYIRHEARHARRPTPNLHIEKTRANHLYGCSLKYEGRVL